MDDLSVYTDDLKRSDLLTKLGQSTSSSKGSDKLKIQLKHLLEKNHIIHKYLNQLTNKKLKYACLIIIEKDDIRDYGRIKKAVASEMFKRFPKAPLATFIWILKSGKSQQKLNMILFTKR